MFSKPKILLITKNAVQLYLNYAEPAELDFTPETIKNLEVVNAEKFSQDLVQFLERNKPASDKIIIVLADDILFEKEITQTGNDTRDAELQKFIDEVPIEAEKKAHLTITQPASNLTIVTNKQLYELVQEALIGQKIQVLNVVPSTFFVAKIATKLDEDTLKKILSSTSDLKNIDFLNSREPLPEPVVKTEDKKDEKVPNTGQNQTKKAILGIVLIALSIILSLYSFGLIKNPLSKRAPTEQTTPVVESNIVESTDSALSENQTTPKQELKIGVLNGSGIEGQALKVKTMLESLGFSNIELGNSTASAGDKTTISFSTSVNDIVKSEIQNELKNTFQEIVVEDMTDNPTYDILIVTGIEKS